MPVENIPVIAAMFGTFAFGVAMFAENAKDSNRARNIQHVRRCERHRKAMRAIELNRLERAGIVNRYHELV